MKKKQIRNANLITAVFLCASPFAPVGLVGYIWWMHTSSIKSTWEGIAALVAGPVLIGLLVLSLTSVFLIAAGMFRNHKRTHPKAAAAAAPERNKVPPEEFLAAHRKELMSINELVLADSALQRPPGYFSYYWHSSEQELQASTYFGWPVTLTEEQLHIFDSLCGSCHFFHVQLTQDSITYSFDSYRSFIYVLQYSKSWDHLRHLEGKWYFSGRIDSME